MTLAEFQAAAADAWGTLPRGAVVWLVGDLGAGKTTFVQALTRSAGAQIARSPTYALVHEYPTRDGAIVHVDCYRLRRPEDAMDLDLAAVRRHARLLVIEWPERAGEYAPPADLIVRLSHVDDPDRRGLELVR